MYNPANFSVNYAASSNYSNSAGSVQSVTAVANVAFVGNGGTIPSGGTWLYVYMPYDTHYLTSRTLAGGATTPANEGGIAVRIA